MPCLALLGGAAIGQTFPFPSLRVWLGTLLLLAAIPALRRDQRSRHAFLLAAAALAGLGLASDELLARAARIAAWIPERSGSWEGSVEGRVLRAPAAEADGTRVLLLEGASAQNDAPSCTLLLRVRLSAAASPAATADLDALRRGDRVRAWCRLRLPVPLGNPGASDPDLSLRARGIDLSGTVKTPRLVVCLDRGRPGLARAVDDVAVRLRGRLDRALGKGDARGLVGAMLLGERGALSPGALRALRDSGTFHVLSVSGLHVALLLAACLLPLRPVSLRRAGGCLQLCVAVAVLALLLAIVGPQPPVARAAAAAALALTGRALGRTGDGLNTLALAAACLVVDRPARLLDPGFQLSFLATAGLLTATRAAAAGLPVPRPAALSLGASVAAYLATAPAVAWHLGRLAPVGLLANLGAAPACACIMATGGAALLLADVPGLGEGAAWLARASAEATLAGARATATVPWGALQVPRPHPALLLALAGVLALAWRSAPGSAPRAGLGLTVALGFVALHVGPPPPGPGRAEVQVLDVGQGLSVLVRGPGGGAVLVDAGGRGNGAFDCGERVVAPAVSRLGLRRVEALVLTHAHDDHAGGAPAVLRQLEVGELWLGPGWTREPLAQEAVEVARARGTALVLVERGFTALRGGCELRVRHPSRTLASTVNDRCVAVLVRAGASRLLVPGDVEQTGALALVEAGDVAAQALVVAHHGSRSGTPTALLDAVRPCIAIVSAGRDNVHGHPHPEIVRRIRRAGIALRRTDRDGSVRLVQSAAGWSEGGGEEGEEEDGGQGHEDREAHASHASRLVGQARMPVAHEHEDHGPEDVRRGPARTERLQAHEGDHGDDRPAREAAVQAARHGVGRVPAVQLPDRKQVQRGHEHAEPAGDPDAVEGERAAGRDAELEEAHQKGSSQGRGRPLAGHAPGDESGEPDRETGEGAGGGDVEERLPVRDHPTHPDDGTKGAERHDAGQEERKRGRDSVTPAGQVVPHFVGTEDREHREGVGSSGTQDVRPQRSAEEGADPGTGAGLARDLLESTRPGDPRGQRQRPSGGRKEEQMEPEAAAERGDGVQAREV